MRSAMTALAVMAVAGFAGCAAVARGAEPTTQAAPVFQTWTSADPEYRFFPGDEVEIVVRTAPELSRTLKIAPDGRIGLPMIAPVMASDLTAPQLSAALSDAYRGILRDPSVDVIARGFGSQQVFVAGEVRTPGALELTAPIDAFQAITRAGGFLTTAHVDEVYILRRMPGGAPRIFRANFSNGALRSGVQAIGPLQRFDVVYVPRSPISEVGLFMQQYVRDALPVNFSLFYDLRGDSKR